MFRSQDEIEKELNNLRAEFSTPAHQSSLRAADEGASSDEDDVDAGYMLRSESSLVAMDPTPMEVPCWHWVCADEIRAGSECGSGIAGAVLNALVGHQ